MTPAKRAAYVALYTAKRAARVAVCPCSKCTAERKAAK